MLNKCIFLGNLTRDPELRKTKTGKSLVNFGVAVNNRKTKEGEQPDVAFIECQAWDTGADAINQYFTKGMPILVECTARTESWEKDGEKKSMLRFRVDKFHFLPRNERKNEKSAEGTEQGSNSDVSNDIPF